MPTLPVHALNREEILELAILAEYLDMAEVSLIRLQPEQYRRHAGRAHALLRQVQDRTDIAPLLERSWSLNDLWNSIVFERQATMGLVGAESQDLLARLSQRA